MITWMDLPRAKEYAGQQVCMAQEKRDGMRLLVTDCDNTVTAVTREGKRDLAPLLRNIPHLWNKISRLGTNSQIDCEIWAPMTQAAHVLTLILAASDKLVLSPFAMPWCDGQDLRTASLLDVTSRMQGMGLEPVPTEYIGWQRANSSEWKHRAFQHGIEGYVLKAFHYDGWYKVKPVKTVDCVVMGHTVSESISYYGDLKAIQVGLLDTDGVIKEVASVGSGFTAEDKTQYGALGSKMVGRVCEVEFDSVAAQGKLKFPRFVRWRDDKRADECLIGQLSI
jgi:ATP-dependent DNA ligase